MEIKLGFASACNMYAFTMTMHIEYVAAVLSQILWLNLIQTLLCLALRYESKCVCSFCYQCWDNIKDILLWHFKYAFNLQKFPARRYIYVFTRHTKTQCTMMFLLIIYLDLENIKSLIFPYRMLLIIILILHFYWLGNVLWLFQLIMVLIWRINWK